jgi:hypothetical protein
MIHSKLSLDKVLGAIEEKVQRSSITDAIAELPFHGTAFIGDANARIDAVTRSVLTVDRDCLTLGKRMGEFETDQGAASVCLGLSFGPVGPLLRCPI